MKGLSSYDLQVVRQEGEDIRYQLKILQADIRTMNNTLNAMLAELIKLNESVPKIGPR